MNRTATTTHLILEAAGIMEEDTIIPASMDPILGIIGTITNHHHHMHHRLPSPFEGTSSELPGHGPPPFPFPPRGHHHHMRGGPGGMHHWAHHMHFGPHGGHRGHFGRGMSHGRRGYKRHRHCEGGVDCKSRSEEGSSSDETTTGN
ncbi:hypothetical protein RHS01_04692 [Rhizoctonia solani]|uniref:Uncharacterized protein n=1 Tax=Rhizoctonia solani TaxID=456999 RepID=A0A8H7M5X7_9AGAM|nr:hypothetical protein RHS01_04692 [Rhizoctonia solani]